MKGVCKHCGKKADYYTWVCDRCRKIKYVRSFFHSGRMIVSSKMGVARKQGLLPDPKLSKCSDCESGATEYDHRDYNEPLKVEPVCRRCNCRRGRAIPKRWLPGEWTAFIEARKKDSRKPYQWILPLLKKFPPEVTA